VIKLIFCLRRRPELSAEEFQRYWREHHGPLVRERAEALGIRRYVQLETLDSLVNEALARPRGGPEPFDGVAELWWDDLDALATSAENDAGRAASRALIEDERRFIDFAASPIWVAREHPIIGPGS
jgi:uncharacterized protein (TIGR02118 family)